MRGTQKTIFVLLTTAALVVGCGDDESTSFTGAGVGGGGTGGGDVDCTNFTAENDELLNAPTNATVVKK